MASSIHFKDKELACKCCKINNCNQELVDSLEELRAIIKKPIKILSGYRCPKYNVLVKGAKKSEHMFGRAADIAVTGMSAVQMESMARLVKSIRGIGRNDYKQFIHVDVREKKAQWCYDKKGNQCRYYPYEQRENQVD
jgi:uncharacterized protein YcbK (DUF882 family)